MAEDARAMTDRMRLPDTKRIMLDIAQGYEELAAWAAKNDIVGDDC